MRSDPAPVQPRSPASALAVPAGRPPIGALLRALREARGVTQDGWAARLGMGRTTVQRWERGETLPDAAGEAALLAICREEGLFRPFVAGPLAGETLSEERLRDLLAAARLGEPRGGAGAASLEPAAMAFPPAADSTASAPAWTPRPLPTGTITFLFTDVEGSTRLWETHAAQMRGVMARHDALLTQVFERHEGSVVRPRGEGDSLFAVFVRATDAVAAALAGQRALAAEDWGEAGPLQVRMGLHTGEADLREGDYYGSAVNRCARIRAAGHGGQILLSQATTLLVRFALPDGTVLRDLGRHRLKDLSEPEQLHQLLAPGLPESFPPLKSLEAQPTNLPRPITSFVGRDQETAEVVALLGTARLLTLTGPGGTGKTRLAVQAAWDVQLDFPDGVFFVDLAPITDPELVAGAIAAALGLRDWGGEQALIAYLREKRLLLLLDNFEQVLGAARLVSRLLVGCSKLTILVTSRTILRIAGEQEFRVPPLPAPHGLSVERPPADAEELLRYAAVALFEERARAVNPHFAPTPADFVAIGAICQRLDGLPLAIELAAARTRVLAPTALLPRLEHSLKLLVSGPRDLPARQYALRDTIAWSYELLGEAERTLFARLAVFLGGCTVEAAEAVCAGDGEIDVLESLQSLSEQSLMQQQEQAAADEPRLRMLETLREFALEKLHASGELAELRRRHAEWVLALAEAADADIRGPRRLLWMNRLSAEQENIRAALAWCVETGAAQTGLRLIKALDQWYRRRMVIDGLRWAEAILALPDADEPSADRAGALASASSLARARDLPERSRIYAQESADIFQTLDDPAGIARALTVARVVAVERGDHTITFHDLVELARRGHDRFGLVEALYYESHMNLGSDLNHSRVLLQEARPIADTIADPYLLRLVHLAFGRLELAAGRLNDSAAHFERVLEQSGRSDDHFDRIAALHDLAIVCAMAGDSQRALALCEELVLAGRRDHIRFLVELTLDTIAGALHGAGRSAVATRLFAAAETIRGGPPRYSQASVTAFVEKSVASARRSLVPNDFAIEWARGSLMSSDEALEAGFAELRLPRVVVGAPVVG